MGNGLGAIFMMLVQGPVAMEYTLRVLNTDVLPINGVEVEVLMDGTGPKEVVDRRVTNATGEVKITYPQGKPPGAITLARPGYRRVTRELRRNYVLLRDFEADRVRGLAETRGPEQVTAVKEWLKDLDQASGDELETVMDDVFRYGARLAPALRIVLKSSEFEEQAIRMLLMTGALAERFELLDRARRRRSSEPDDEAWVAQELLNPRNEREWTIIRALLWGSGKESRRVLDTVIQTLRLTGGRRSEELLLAARSRYPSARRDIDKALTYLRGKPLPFRGRDLTELAKRVANELGEDGWRGNFGLQFSEGRDRAVVYLRYDIQVYNATCAATFVQRRDWWELEAVRRISWTFVDGPPPGNR